MISDIHEDFQSLKLASKNIEQRNCDKIACLGDIVGFSVPFYNYLDSRNPSACVSWVMENCSFSVAGNHDLFAISKVPVSEVMSFKYPENWYQLSFQERERISAGEIWLYENNELSAMLDNKEAEYLRNLPEYIITNIEGHTVMFSHYIFPDLTGSSRHFVTDYQDLMSHIELLKSKEAGISFSGHMHCNGIKSISGQEIFLTPFGKKFFVSTHECFGLPAISSSKNSPGFAIWDTNDNSIETISLRKKFKLL